MVLHMDIYIYMVHGHPFHIGNPYAMGIKRIVVNGWPAPNLGTQWNTIEWPQRISDGPWLVHRCSSLLSPKRLAVTGWWLTYPSEKYEFSSSVRMMKFHEIPWNSQSMGREYPGPKKIWKSVGIIIPNIWKVIEFHGFKPPTVVMGDKLLTTNQTLSTRQFTGIPSGIIQMAMFFSPKNEGLKIGVNGNNNKLNSGFSSTPCLSTKG